MGREGKAYTFPHAAADTKSPTKIFIDLMSTEPEPWTWSLLLALEISFDDYRDYCNFLKEYEKIQDHKELSNLQCLLDIPSPTANKN